MGILADPVRWIEELAPTLPERFAVCELGDQFVTCVEPHLLARDLYLRLGAGRYRSLDGNGLNGAHVHDLNRPVHPALAGEFDLVTDFGTGEHVFDQKTVWYNVHHLCRVGGYIMFDRPMAGYPTHCYYLIQPELIRDLAYANDYEVLRLEELDTVRGRLLRGLMCKTRGGKFTVPQQGRYRKTLRV